MSYSTPTLFAARIGPRILAQLSAESGTAVSTSVIQGWLTAATNTIDIRIGNRYTVPVTAPATQLTRLGAIEEDIALWGAWVYRGIGDQESAASAAKVGYDAAMKLLDAVAAGDIDLTGVTLRPAEVTTTDTANWKSNMPVYTNENFKSF